MTLLPSSASSRATPVPTPIATTAASPNRSPHHVEFEDSAERSAPNQSIFIAPTPPSSRTRRTANFAADTAVSPDIQVSESPSTFRTPAPPTQHRHRLFGHASSIVRRGTSSVIATPPSALASVGPLTRTPLRAYNPSATASDATPEWPRSAVARLWPIPGDKHHQPQASPATPSQGTDRYRLTPLGPPRTPTHPSKTASSKANLSPHPKTPGSSNLAVTPNRRRNGGIANAAGTSSKRQTSLRGDVTPKGTRHAGDLSAAHNHNQPSPSRLATSKQAHVGVAKTQISDPVKLAQYRSKFKKCRFYFYPGGSRKTAEYENECKKLSNLVKRLGGTNAMFLDKNVTHFLIPDNAPTPPKKNDELAQPMEVAKRFQITVWSLSRLRRVMNTLIGGDIVDATPRKLQDYLHDEKLFGVSTNRGEGSQPAEKSVYRIFKERYLLVEELSDRYRPVVVREYKDVTGPDGVPPWPVIHFQDRQGRCAFLKYPTSRVGKSADKKSPRAVATEGSRKENAQPVEKEAEGSQPLLKQQPFVDQIPRKEQSLSAASGLVSNSATLLPRRDPLAAVDPKMVMLGQREKRLHADRPNNKRKRGAPTAMPVQNDHPQKRHGPTKANHIAGKAFYSRPGYCENCNVKYDEFSKHAESPIHKGWLKNHADFTKLDQLIEKLKRPSVTEGNTAAATNVEFNNVESDTVIANDVLSLARQVGKGQCEARRQSLPKDTIAIVDAGADNPFLVEKRTPVVLCHSTTQGESTDDIAGGSRAHSEANKSVDAVESLPGIPDTGSARPTPSTSESKQTLPVPVPRIRLRLRLGPPPAPKPARDASPDSPRSDVRLASASQNEAASAPSSILSTTDPKAGPIPSDRKVELHYNFSAMSPSTSATAGMSGASGGLAFSSAMTPRHCRRLGSVREATLGDTTPKKFIAKSEPANETENAITGDGNSDDNAEANQRGPGQPVERHLSLCRSGIPEMDFTTGTANSVVEHHKSEEVLHRDHGDDTAIPDESPTTPKPRRSATASKEYPVTIPLSPNESHGKKWTSAHMEGVQADSRTPTTPRPSAFNESAPLTDGNPSLAKNENQQLDSEHGSDASSNECAASPEVTPKAVVRRFPEQVGAFTSASNQAYRHEVSAPAEGLDTASAAVETFGGLELLFEDPAAFQSHSGSHANSSPLTASKTADYIRPGQCPTEDPNRTEPGTAADLSDISDAESIASLRNCTPGSDSSRNGPRPRRELWKPDSRNTSDASPSGGSLMEQSAPDPPSPDCRIMTSTVIARSPEFVSTAALTPTPSCKRPRKTQCDRVYPLDDAGTDLVGAASSPVKRRRLSSVLQDDLCRALGSVPISSDL
ncbi:hypothetical protein HDU85_007749 [Gaertneriomyces sp. JEL0708]|nr:hypothetical protein HDU85_007749 [Gaertneriomyces sp. JEL0708]